MKPIMLNAVIGAGQSFKFDTVPSTSYQLILAYPQNSSLYVKKLSWSSSNSLISTSQVIDPVGGLALYSLDSNPDGGATVIWHNLVTNQILSQTYSATDFVHARARVTHAAQNSAVVIGVCPLSILNPLRMREHLGLGCTILNIPSDCNPVAESVLRYSDVDILQIKDCTLSGYKGLKCLEPLPVKDPSVPNVALQIDADMGQCIVEYLKNKGSVVVYSPGELTLTTQMDVNCKDKTLALASGANINFEVGSLITLQGPTTLEIKSGINVGAGAGNARINFREAMNAQVIVADSQGKVMIHYNPNIGAELHKYHNPTSYFDHISPLTSVTAYMLLNNCQDLQDINYALGMNYALSQDIDCKVTTAGNPNPFKPITTFDRVTGEQFSFSGSLDGNGFKIKNLNLPYQSVGGIDVALFSRCDGSLDKYVSISNIGFENCNTQGGRRAGVVCGHGQYAEFKSITLIRSNVQGAVIGGVVGAAVFF